MALPHQRKVLVNHHQRLPGYSILTSVTRCEESFMLDGSLFGAFLYMCFRNTAGESKTYCILAFQGSLLYYSCPDRAFASLTMICIHPIP